MSLVLLFHYLLLNVFRMLEYIHLQELATYCGFISCVVLLWFDVCWCYGVVRLGWCGILMQAEALYTSWPINLTGKERRGKWKWQIRAVFGFQPISYSRNPLRANEIQRDRAFLSIASRYQTEHSYVELSQASPARPAGKICNKIKMDTEQNWNDTESREVFFDTAV